MQKSISRRFTSLFLVALALSIIIGIAAHQSPPTSAHSAVSHVVESKVCPKHAHHLTPFPSTVIDGDTPAFVVLQACRIHRNDVYQVIFSDPCISLASENALVADNEGRLSFAVILFHCDPDIYVVTLRDLSPNHAKYHALIIVDAA